MSRLIRWLPAFLAFICAMRMWQYYFGVRMPVHDLVLVSVTGCFFLRWAARRRVPLPPHAIRQALIVLGAIQLLGLATLVQLDFTLGTLPVAQFAKGVVSILIYALGIAALWFTLADEQGPDPRTLLQAYLLGAIASAMYSFAEITLAWRGFDLGKVVFGSISRYPPDFDWTKPFYYEWDGFFRAQGFAGVNTQGTYLASAIPLLLLTSPFRHRAINLGGAALCLGGLALTLSRTGFAMLLLSLAFCIVLRPNLIRRLAPLLLLTLLPVAALVAVYPNEAKRLVGTRLYSSLQEFGSGRWDIYGPVWELVKERPFGHGLNQFAVVIQHTDKIDMINIHAMYPSWTDAHARLAYANVHNNWLNWLFEGGWLLVSAQMLYHSLLLRVCYRQRTNLGLTATAVMASFLIVGFFNMTLDLLFAQLVFVLLPAAVFGEGRVRPDAPAPGSAPC